MRKTSGRPSHEMTTPYKFLRQGLALVLLLGLCSAPLQAADATADAAATFLAALQDETIEQLTDPSVDESEREQRFRQLFNKGFDLPTIGRFVIGRYWRGASQQDRDDFLAVFEDVIVQRFLPILTENSDQRFEIGKVTEDSRAPGTMLVASKIARPEGEPYKVTWRIRFKDEQYKVLDVVAEGISMGHHPALGIQLVDQVVRRQGKQPHASAAQENQKR